MTNQDPISNLLASIANAQSRKKEEVAVPSSTQKVALAEVLKKNGYIKSYNVSNDDKPNLTIQLKYFEGLPVIKELKRVSRPGLRNYKRKHELPEVNGGLGVAIISTSKGLMTDSEAREAGLGGEVLCSVF
tara:strand:- start:19394 stop:19786 length:393 start_codon:yes stop_codon:yes gene_type:complete